jgi:hypothetical protein
LQCSLQVCAIISISTSVASLGSPAAERAFFVSGEEKYFLTARISGRLKREQALRRKLSRPASPNADKSKSSGSRSSESDTAG